jgi:hypothetical protein
LLTKRSVLPAGTTVRKGTKREPSCEMTTGVAAGRGAVFVGGCTSTTTSAAGLPSLSVMATCTVPAWALPRQAANASAAASGMGLCRVILKS